MSKEPDVDYVPKMGDRVTINLGDGQYVPMQPIHGTIVGVLGSNQGVQVRWDDEQVSWVHVCDVDLFRPAQARGEAKGAE